MGEAGGIDWFSVICYLAILITVILAGTTIWWVDQLGKKGVNCPICASSRIINNRNPIKLLIVFFLEGWDPEYRFTCKDCDFSF
jgi:hypothetical protein